MTEITQQKINQQKRQFYIKSSILAFLVIVIVVFSTLIAYRMPWMYDMTAGKVFTLSDSTIQLVQSLPAPVQIIAVYPVNAVDPMISSLLAEYVKVGNNLTVDFIDAEREPTKLAQYNLNVTAVSNGTLIVLCGGKNKTLYATDMFQSSSDGNAFWGERQITGAIRYVTATDMPVVYFLEGHEESSTTAQFSQARAALELDIYNVETLNLLKSGFVPKDAALLIIASPKKDLSESEYTILQDYMLKGGKALFMVDAMSTNTVVLGNFNKLMHSFAIDISNNLVVEEDASAHVSNNNLYLIPGYAYHYITTKLAENKRYIVLPIVMGLHSLDFNKDEIRLELLLASSQRSWMRSDVTINSSSKTENDTQGPIPLAYASTRLGGGYGTGDSLMIVVGNSTFINNENIDVYANRDFYLSCVNWLAGGRVEESISPRIIGADKLIVRGNDFIKLMIICLVILPLIPFTSALVIWYLRRNQ